MNTSSLSRFQIASYIRSYRVIQPLIAVFVLLFLFTRVPPRASAESILGIYGSLTIFMILVWAWTARQLLDTQPDAQRQISTIALGSRMREASGGLLAAYMLNSIFAAVLAGPLIAQTIALPLSPTVHLLGVGLLLLIALPATVLGAWTSRPVIPSPGTSALAVLGGTLGMVLLNQTPLMWVSVPIIPLVRAAHAGPSVLTHEMPALTIHTILWSGIAASVYVCVRVWRP